MKSGSSHTTIARGHRATGSSPDRLCDPGKCKDRRSAGRASTAPGPEAPDPACRGACRCGPPRSTPALRSASGSSFAQNAQNPTKRIDVDLVVDAHAASGAELDFDDPGPRSPSAHRRTRWPRRLRRRWRRRRLDLNRKQNRTVHRGWSRRARQPSPCEEQALRHPVPSSDLAHHGSGHQCLFDNPRLLVLAPAPSALDTENLPIHLCRTLRLALRSQPPRRPSLQQGGRRRRDTTQSAAAVSGEIARPVIGSSVRMRTGAGSSCSARTCSSPSDEGSQLRQGARKRAR